MFLPLIILISALGAQIFLRSFDRGKLFKRFFIVSLVLVFLYYLYLSWVQYDIWLKHSLSRYLLPPHQPINFFLFYSLMRFFAPYLISLGISLLFILAAKRMNKKYGERFFEPEEIYFGAISLFLAGHPGWLVYLTLLIVFYLAIQFFFNFVLGRKGERIPLYYLWLPAAIFVIIINALWLYKMWFWKIIKI